MQDKPGALKDAGLSLMHAAADSLDKEFNEAALRRHLALVLGLSKIFGDGWLEDFLTSSSAADIDASWAAMAVCLLPSFTECKALY